MIVRASVAGFLPALVSLVVTAGCAPDTSGSIATGLRHDAQTAEVDGPDTRAATSSPDADTLATPTDTTTADEATAHAPGVCERWNADRADLSEGHWTGAVASCNAGELLDPGPDNILRQVNLYRWLAGLPAVTRSADLDAAAQACSLIMQANHTIAHDVSDSWTCYGKTGADAAALSNLATTPGVAAIDLYMVDPGNEDTLGHRRWILSNSLGPIGVGSTSAYSCLRVIGGSGDAGNLFTAWPPAGTVPLAALGSYPSVDETGWSVQSDAYDLRGATVSVTRDDGQVLAVTTSALASGYGSASALEFVPDGWRAEAGHTYHVAITRTGAPISYDVTVVDCD